MGDNECVLWTGATNSTGYGWMRQDGRTRMAHRVLWEKAYGPLPADLELDHLCRVRLCIRLDHLEPVTASENNTRAWKTASRYRPAACPKGHEYTPENTRTWNRPGRATPARKCRTCERESKR